MSLVQRLESSEGSRMVQHFRSMLKVDRKEVWGLLFRKVVAFPAKVVAKVGGRAEVSAEYMSWWFLAFGTAAPGTSSKEY